MNEDIILLIGDFNPQTLYNQAIILIIFSNANILWLDEDYALASKYNRSSADVGDNVFGSKIVKLYNAHNLIICNGLIKCPNYIQITCTRGLGSSVVSWQYCKFRDFKWAWSSLISYSFNCNPQYDNA